MTDSEIRQFIQEQVAAQLQAITSKDVQSETDVPTLSDSEWDSNKSITSLPVVYNGNLLRKVGITFLRTLRNAAAVVSTAWNALTNNGTNVSWIPTVNSSGVAGKSSPADLASVLGANYKRLTDSDTLDDISVEGKFYFTQTSIPQGLPNSYGTVDSHGILICHKADGLNLWTQILYKFSQNIIYYRRATFGAKIWQPWHKITMVQDD